jgi:hypothetical protein
MLFRELKPTEARQPKATDHFFVQPCGTNQYGQRQYTILNIGHKQSTAWTVTFMRSTTGVKLAHCTCPDFQINLQQCKHLLPTAGLHVAVMRQLAKQDAPVRSRSAERAAIIPSAATA